MTISYEVVELRGNIEFRAINQILDKVSKKVTIPLIWTCTFFSIMKSLHILIIYLIASKYLLDFRNIILTTVQYKFLDLQSSIFNSLFCMKIKIKKLRIRNSVVVVFYVYLNINYQGFLIVFLFDLLKRSVTYYVNLKMIYINV